jgi:hypothetical protein
MIPLPPKFIKKINMGLVDVGSRYQQIRVYIHLHNRNATDGSSEGAVQNQLIVWAHCASWYSCALCQYAILLVPCLVLN